MRRDMGWDQVLPSLRPGGDAHDLAGYLYGDLIPEFLVPDDLEWPTVVQLKRGSRR